MTGDKRGRPLKRLQICPKRAGYMQPLSAFKGHTPNRGWKRETFHRSFGGVEVRELVCEKCHHVETFRIDDLMRIGEDD